MNTNTDNSDDKKLHPRMNQDNIERESNAYSRGAMTTAAAIFAVLAVFGYFYYQASYVPTAVEAAPVSRTEMVTPAAINATPTDAYRSTTTTAPDNAATTNATVTP